MEFRNNPENFHPSYQQHTSQLETEIKRMSELNYFLCCRREINQTSNMKYGKTCLKRSLETKIKKWFPRPIIDKCRSKVLQNAPVGAFCNSFDLL